MIHTFAWILPLFSALVWIGMLLGLLLHWVTIGKPIYPSMDPGQHIAYISDVGAYELKPLFIAGAATTVVTLNAGMACERWLRHRGNYLARNTSKFEKGADIFALFAAIVGGVAIICLTIFDTASYPTVHDDLLVVFIVGYVVSAIAICTEYQRLGIKYRQHAVLRYSFWFKLFFIIIEIALAIPFGVFETTGSNVNTAAVLEWIIALVYAGYVLTFFLDLLPALRSVQDSNQVSKAEMAYAKSRYPGEAYPDHGTYENSSSPGDSHTAPTAQTASNF